MSKQRLSILGQPLSVTIGLGLSTFGGSGSGSGASSGDLKVPIVEARFPTGEAERERKAASDAIDQRLPWESWVPYPPSRCTGGPLYAFMQVERRCNARTMHVHMSIGLLNS